MSKPIFGPDPNQIPLNGMLGRMAFQDAVTVGQVIALEADPTSQQIPAGTWAVVTNTTDSTTKLWANVGGTLVSVALA